MANIRKVALSALVRSARKFHHSPNVLSKLYEPDYLESMKSNVPLYDTLNIQLRGYDYPILESYQKFVHNLAKNMDIDVEECWAVPPQEIQVTTLKPNSEILNAQYNLKTYERTVQITDVPATQLPILIRALESSTPSGVTVHVLPHEDWFEEIRYVPDSALKALKDELDEMGGPSKKK